MPLHVHLDALGGVAGDMFAAALLDARPDLEPTVQRAIAAISGDDGLSFEAAAHGDGVLRGKVFTVACPAPPASTPASDLRDRMVAAALDTAVKARAVAMLDLLANAEAKVHGIPAAEVKFHELGGLDTLVDLVAAAALIEALGSPTWSCGALPRGRGTVKTAHGVLPVPAPATSILLEGMVVIDDGIDGERITPTGAAILRHLAPAQAADFTPRRLIATGHGFGTRRLVGRSNVLRAQIHENSEVTAADRVAVLEFDIDDQTAEDLAVGLDRLRGTDGVIDVVQQSVIGKQGRHATQVRVLAEPGRIDAVAAICFRETTTIGLRWTVADRMVLSRESVAGDGEQGAVRVKVVARNDGSRTAKAEIGDVADHPGGHTGRATARRRAEDKALDKEPNDSDA